MNASRIDKCRQQLRSRTPLFGGWLQNHAVKTLAEDGSAEAMRVLADTVVQAAEEALAAAALEALRQLARDNVAAREALCRLVIHHDEPGARQIVAAAGYVPHE